MKKYLSLSLLLLCIAQTLFSHAQIDTLTAPQVGGSVLRVGLINMPPLSSASKDGYYDGLAVQLWQAAAEKANITFDYVLLNRQSAAKALDAGDIDAYLTATPITGRQDSLSHSPIYYSSNLAVAKREKGGFLQVVKRLFQPAFFQIIAALCIMLLIVGVIIYFVERKVNEDQFGGRLHEGIGAGFWWAGVTLTTIGYGDKAPISFWGRMVAMLWMLVGLAVSATLTAALVSLSDGDDSALSLPGDLQSAKKNVTLTNHPLIPALGRLDVPYTEVADLKAGFDALENKTADYFIANGMELRHYKNAHSSDLKIQTSRLEANYFAIGFRQNLPQADTLSILVQDITMSSLWPTWLNQYVPPEN